MIWYKSNNKEKDIILSSRIRFARNLSEYPFASRMDDTSAKEIIEKIENALGKDYKKTDFSTISHIEALSFAERHLVSREFAEKKTPHALFTDKEEEISVMACEEDHIRLQCILPGYDLERAYELACKCDDLLDASLKLAYDKDLGYLTHCPTNLGTGMRASVMMFLPALTHAKKISSLSNGLSKLGLTIRGMYGEGSGNAGMLYQISNQVTLGISEEDTLSKLKDIISQICELEKKYRETIKENSYESFEDKVNRAEGILRYATVMSSSEFMKLYSDIRLGISLGMIKDIDINTLDMLFVEILPATLTLLANCNESETERDRERAKFIKRSLDR